MRRKWHYYTNGTDEISVYEDDIPPEGFYLGRKPMSAETRARQSASAKRRPSNTKGKKLSDTARHNMSVSKKQFFTDNPEWESPTQWKQGHTPWNKGVPMRPESRAKLSNSRKGYKLNPEALAQKLEREYATKKKNNSFHTSEIEQTLKNVLFGMFGEDGIEHQYRDPRYPFNCDFYIKLLDVFIEVNYTWTHGGHPFNPNDLDDIYVLEQWQEKAKTSKYYKTAIKVWTETDAKKIQTAINNNLNYFVIYNKEDLHDFITRIQAICKEHPLSTG